MPTYDYLCENCGHKFEKFQQMSANPLKKCPECSKMKLKRLIGTGAGIIFKGSGFYETDYRSESYTKGKSAASASSAASTTTTASDTKAAKSDSTKTAEKKTPAKKDAAAKGDNKKSA